MIQSLYRRHQSSSCVGAELTSDPHLRYVDLLPEDYSCLQMIGMYYIMFWNSFMFLCRLFAASQNPVYLLQSIYILSKYIATSLLFFNLNSNQKKQISPCGSFGSNLLVVPSHC